MASLRFLPLSLSLSSPLHPSLRFSPPLSFPTSKPKPSPRPRRSPILAVSTGRYPPVPFAPAISSEPDDIGAFNDRLRRDHRQRFRSSPDAVDPREAEEYLKSVREQQLRGLTKLKGELPDDGSFGYKVDPYALEPGDYVVHKKFGIGEFENIAVDASRDGEPEDYVFIKYADGMAKLSVRKALKSLYRYSLPKEKKKPPLCKLNDTSSWRRRKIKGQLTVQKMVVDLMELYMHRLKQKRPPYLKAPLMEEFAAQFPYEPTPDQTQAFIDVERDLTERETPMDRLICGDVGFGKTEVAQRAIFCVVSAGKQAMVLAPTVVLARQHFEVISERFFQYPNIKVGLLSRLQTKSEKDGYLSMIRQGHLDIIVGTHALLGSQVVYNNLGLLVVDEEQRFGVKQKEKIASLKTSVDVLSLSATPIPRTLYLALTGFRDASLISTPPPERVPIKTHLLSFSEDRVVSAIKNELDRGGQVYYVRPRIKGLEEVEAFLKHYFSDVGIAIAHGKLQPKQLEETIMKFASGEIKILICTNIVESGLDIQNANTIIIHDVHMLGLAQLYQLRGRVGRADKEAYAYLFYPDKSVVTDQALERFSALGEYRELGQGFQLAERDMGIRGFGNIFGEQQTGNIGNVGVDLFFEMLFESLSKVEENRLVAVPYKDVEVEISVTVRHSSEYINYLENPLELANESEKAAEEDIWSLMEFTENLRQKYGKEPRSMEIFLKNLYIRRMAADLGISKVYVAGKVLFMKTHMTKKVFKLMQDSMTSPVHRNSLTFDGSTIQGSLLLELPKEQLLNWVFQCLSQLYASLPSLVKC